MMIEWTRTITKGVAIAFVFQSGSLLSSKFRPFVAEGFSNRGKSRMRFSQTSFSCSKNFETEPSKEIGNVLGQPPYKIAGLDLSALWIDLVRRNKVSASMSLPSTKSKDGVANDEGESATVEYGIRLTEKVTEKADETMWAFEEYVSQMGLNDGVVPNPLISDINATLARSHRRSSGSGVDFKQVGNFVAQLQLVRTLRPPPSEGFQEATTCVPPPYNPETDSFVTGPLRLELRPLVGRLSLPTNDGGDMDEKNNGLTTSWDVFHNISPADRRGHFLLLPSLLNKDINWRGQSLTKEDCHDLVHLTSSIEPVGSIFIGYNSVGAGASQNHIHCHSWPYPNIDSTRIDTDDDEEDEFASFCYAVNNIGKIYDFYDIYEGKVEVSYLNYPVFCIQMSSSVANLDLLGRTLATCLEAIGEAPHNVGFFNRVFEIEDDGEEDENEIYPVENLTEKMVDVFLFARSKERSSILPTLKLGISEMMGIFHAQSEAELDALSAVDTVTNEEGKSSEHSAMEQALADVSYEDDEELWNNMIARLEALDKGD